jgi:hypothetical protein
MLNSMVFKPGLQPLHRSTNLNRVVVPIPTPGPAPDHKSRGSVLTNQTKPINFEFVVTYTLHRAIMHLMKRYRFRLDPD